MKTVSPQLTDILCLEAPSPCSYFTKRFSCSLGGEFLRAASTFDLSSYLVLRRRVCSRLVAFAPAGCLECLTQGRRPAYVRLLVEPCFALPHAGPSSSLAY